MGRELLAATLAPRSYSLGEPMAVFHQIAAGTYEADVVDAELQFLSEGRREAFERALGYIFAYHVSGGDVPVSLQSLRLPTLYDQVAAGDGAKINLYDAWEYARWRRHYKENVDGATYSPLSLQDAYAVERAERYLADTDFMAAVEDFWELLGAGPVPDGGRSIVSEMERCKRLLKDHVGIGGDQLALVLHGLVQGHSKHVLVKIKRMRESSRLTS